jgi:uncharacterized protein (DUF433 family)
MSLAIQTEPIPLESDADGVIRVGGTRVPFDSVIHCFRAGATAEEIAYQYPILRLADIYAVISYYLKHKKEAESYLLRRQNISEQVRRQNQMRFSSDGIRDRLAARGTKKQR